MLAQGRGLGRRILRKAPAPAVDPKGVIGWAIPGLARVLQRLPPIVLVAALACAPLARPARADTAEPPHPPPPPAASSTSAARRALNLSVAIVPGLALHGAGHAVAGHWGTARSLFGIELAGLGVAAAGALTFWYSGASRRLVGPATALTLLGGSALVASWLADLYGVVVPEGGTGAPERELPWVEAGLGYRRVYDPRFLYQNLAGASLDLRFRPLHLAASAWTALDAENQRLRATFAYRVTGPRPAHAGIGPTHDGSFLDLSIGLTHHAYHNEGFARTLGEGFALGRLDLDRIGPTLLGSFAELGLGWALGSSGYVRGSSEAVTLLLMRFAFGLYLGVPGRPHGEIALVYDHRHDDYAAGLLMNGVVSGVLGHLGLEGAFYFSGPWGVAAEVQVGSAALLGLSLRYRVPSGKVK
jgi:hypothetical protein